MANESTTMIVPEAPPEAPIKRRRSRWAEVFEEARQRPDDWVRVLIPLKKSTVSQIASDIRNAHKRETPNRMRGLRDDEKWDATWGERDDKHWVWIRYLGKE